MVFNSPVLQSESVITQRLYRHFKRTPGTHKLGVLYVVDSVTRQWIEKKNRQSSQDLAGSSAPDGTFASGIHKITELLPSLIDDLAQNAPSDHKVSFNWYTSRHPSHIPCHLLSATFQSHVLTLTHRRRWKIWSRFGSVVLLFLLQCWQKSRRSCLNQCLNVRVVAVFLRLSLMLCFLH